MVSSTRQAVACILVIFSAAVFALAQTVQPKEPAATITGKVTIKGKGAPGIFVGLRRQESSYNRQVTGFRAVTDSEGKYRIENVPVGSYAVTPVAPAYISDEAGNERTLIVNKGETIENIDFVLIRGGAITGRVVDRDGRPMIEEEVTALPEPENTRGHMRYLGVRTDDRGIYRIFGLPAGRYKVGAASDGLSRYYRASYKRTFYPGVEDIAQATVLEVSEGGEVSNIDLTVGGSITTYSAYGKVLDGVTGQPLPNVSYGITRYFDENSSSSSSSGAVTNNRGEFRLDSLSPGKYGVSIHDRTGGEWRADELRFEVVDSDLTGLVIRTEKAASISGVVVLEGADDKVARDHFARAHVNASVINEGARRGSGATAAPGPDGSFRLTGLSSGTANFHVYAQTAHFRIARVERNGVIQPNGIDVKHSEQITGVRIVVNYGNATLRGTIVLQNGTLPTGAGFFVWLRRLNDEPNAMHSWSDASPQMDSRGQFLVENLFPGTYEVHAGIVSAERREQLFNTKQEVVVTAGANNNMTITLDLSSRTPRP